MAKKLIQSYYVFDLVANTLTVNGYVKLEELLIITNVTLNDIVYNFADPTKGATLVFDEETEKSTITLTYAAIGATNADKFQIFIDTPEQKIDVSDSLLDPVHKLRVSNPQNLIDTDFEYGLQPTKWETLELSNNVPSYYVDDGDGVLGNVVSVNATAGSNQITIVTDGAHNLPIGIPIQVLGLSSRSAEGKHLIKFVTTNTIVYTATAIQTITGNIGGAYTTISPGRFYNAADITYIDSAGIVSNGDTNSQITITTQNPHGFVSGSNFYLTNTIANKKFLYDANTNTSNTAPDLDRIVEFDNTVTRSINVDSTLTETKQFIPLYNKKFDATAVDVGTNTISWPLHGLRNNDCLLYIKPAGDTSIGGLSSLNVYYVIVINPNTISLASTYNGLAIDFTSAGTYNYGRACIGLVYEIARAYNGNIFSRYVSVYTTFNQLGSGSGWDLSTNFAEYGGYGLGGVSSQRNNAKLFLARNGENLASSSAAYLNRYSTYYSTASVPGINFPDNNVLPSTRNFIEDFDFWGGPSFNSSPGSFYGGRYWLTNPTGPSLQSYSNLTGLNLRDFGPNLVFWAPLIKDPEGESFYAQNHGLESGTNATFVANSGSLVRQIGVNGLTQTVANNSIVNVEVKSNDRFGFILDDTSQKIYTGIGNFTFNAEVEKATKNTFYFNDHGLSNGQRVKFELDPGGVLPTTQTGEILINSTTTTEISYTTLQEAFLNAWGENNLTDIPTPTAAEISQGYVIGPSDIGNMVQGARIINSSFLSDYTTGSFLGSVAFASSSNVGDLYSGALYQPLVNNNQFSPYNASLFATDIKNVSSNSFLLQVLSIDSTFYQGITNRGLRVQWFPLFSQYIFDGFIGVVATQQSVNSYTATYNSWYTGWTMNAYTSGGLYYNNLTVKARPRNLINATTGVGGFRASNGAYIVGTLNEITWRGDLHFNLFWVSTDNFFSNTIIVNNFVNSLVQYYDSNFRYPDINTSDYYTVKVATPTRFSLSTDLGVQIDLTNSGTAPFSFLTEPTPGIADDAYTAETTTPQTITFQTGSQVIPVEYEFNASLVQANRLQTTLGNHFVPGAQVQYSAEGNAPVSGLVDGGVYYVYPVDNTYLSLAESEQQALSEDLITITSSTGTHKLISQSISGYAETPGTIEIFIDSPFVKGTDTLFKRYFKIKDTITFEIQGTPGRYETYTVLSIADDSNMQLSSSVSETSSNVKAFTKTQVYTRPDGFAVHRPFDGGVEIAAGTAPYSQILRQTRKYFRYQSGKGIQTSLAINFNPPVLFETLSASGTVVTGTTKYPHRLSDGQNITVKNASDPVYNNEFEITKIDDFTFTFDLGVEPTTTIPDGIIKFNLVNYSGAATRAGMFDFQNGFFYEYDGQTINCVRRSSTTQLSGTVSATTKSNKILGQGTNFTGQIQQGNFVVIRGITYKVISILNRTEMYVQPEYRGESTRDAVLTLVEDVTVPQNEWNIDKCDGQGPEGYHLDINAIQMAYMDYSWYGAGKIRFGFKDRSGHVRYVHEFIHNNRLDEAYMRSGNLPAKYEVINDETPSYAPTLFHWGTSVIMDGKFDEDEAYLFTAPSNTLTFFGGDTLTINTSAQSNIVYIQINRTQRDYYLRLPFATTAASSIVTGATLSTASGALEDVENKTIEYTDYGVGVYYAYLYLGRAGNNNPPTGPVVPSGTPIIIGGTGTVEVSLGTDLIPLVSLRLSPSVDSNLPGGLGERDIINRMQLKLKEVGLILTHDCEVKLVLNGSLSNVSWGQVGAPSLSQLLKHDFGETLSSGVEVFSFRAAGGQVDSTGRRSTNASEFALDAVIDMGNSILGGDGVYPNGPDVLTIAVQLIDTSQVSSASPFQASGRITWSESQA